MESKSLSKAELLRELKKAQAIDNAEVAHLHADSALLNFINDDEIYNEWTKVHRQYGGIYKNEQ